MFFLPGILGSEMWFEGQPVWTLKKIVEIAASSLTGNVEQFQAALDLLKLHDEDESLDELDDGVTTPWVLQQENHIPQWVPLFGKTNVYDDMLICLSQMGPRADQFIPFPYDWRRSVRALARRFGRLAREKLAAWRRRYGSEARLFIVGHSMGGLIATYFCEVLEGWRDTAHLITLGTPHRGAVKPVQALLDGSPVFSADMIRSCTSVYHLATPVAALQTPRGLVTFKDFPGSSQVHERFEDSWNLYQEIADARARNSHEEGYRDFSLSIVRATKLRTVQALATAEPTGVLSPLFKIDSLVGGDGTIPTFASLPQDWRGTPIEVRQEHAWLANWSGAIDFVKDTWHQTVRSPEVYLGPPSLIEEMEAPDVLSTDEPLLLRIVAKAVRDRLKVRLSAKDQPPTVREFSCQSEEATHLKWPGALKRGDYQVDVWMASESQESALTSSVSIR